MTEDPWNKHTPGDPMPCKCSESVVEVRFRNVLRFINIAKYLDWAKDKDHPSCEIDEWRFIKRKGEDVIQRCAECDCEGGSSECNWIKSGPADPYNNIIWDEEDIAIVVLEKPGRPEWVRDDDLVRFCRQGPFCEAVELVSSGETFFAFRIKRRPVRTPAEPQLLAVLSAATDDEADAIRSAARRANIEVPE